MLLIVSKATIGASCVDLPARLADTSDVVLSLQASMPSFRHNHYKVLLYSAEPDFPTNSGSRFPAEPRPIQRCED
jgi:hypothetical protein